MPYQIAKQMRHLLQYIQSLEFTRVHFDMFSCDTKITTWHYYQYYYLNRYCNRIIPD